MATVPAPDLAPHPFPPEPARDDFDGPALGIHFQTLRVPPDESLLSLRERPGWLRLRGQESPSSNFRQSLVCRRWQSFRFTASTCVEFEPETFQQMAGLICFYDGGRFYYLRISHDERLGKCVGLLSCVGGQHDQPAEDRSIEGQRRCWLRVNVDHDRLWFEHSADGCVWQAIGPVLDAGALADEAAPQGGFTGAFVGVCAQDLSGRRHPADFDWFEYREAAE
jgi:xylan 1,4-beta-xylosidase